MPEARYIVAYDIADRRRLSRTARLLERQALRIQKSVFLFSGCEADVKRLMAELRQLIDPHEDVVEAWPLKRGDKKPAYSCGVPHRLSPSCLIMIGGRHIPIEDGRES